MKTPCTKKILYLVAMLLYTVLLPKEGKGQTILRFDFKEKKFTQSSIDEIENLKQGETYVLIVDSINMNIYDVNVGGRDTFYTSSATLPVISTLASDNLTSVLSKLVASTTAIKAEISDESVVEGLQVRLGDAVEKRSYKVDTLDFLYDFEKNAPIVREFYKGFKMPDSSLQDNKKRIENEIWVLDQDIKNLENLIANAVIEAKTRKNKKKHFYEELTVLSGNLRIETVAMLGTINEINRLLSAINFQQYNYYSGLYGFSNVPNSGEFGYISIAFISTKTGDLMNKLAGHVLKTRQIQADLNKLIQDFSEVKEGVLVISDSTTKVRVNELGSAITALITEIKTSQGVLQNDSLNASYMKLLFLENNSERTFRSMPIQLTGDAQVVNISIKPRNTAFGLSAYETKYTFPIPKFYASVSAGYYYAFDLQDDFYSIKETRSSDTSYSLVKENQAKGEVGFNALLHGGCRIVNSKFGAHLSLGPGLSIGSSSQFRMMVGGGLSYGATRSKLTLDVLYITGYVMKLSDAYTEDYQSTERPTQVTVSKRNSSVALSIGYMYKF